MDKDDDVGDDCGDSLLWCVGGRERAVFSDRDFEDGDWADLSQRVEGRSRGGNSGSGVRVHGDGGELMDGVGSMVWNCDVGRV